MLNAETLVYFVFSAFAVLVTLTVHEYCHAYAAYKLGDPTARALGRLTLNPIKHLDPIGALCMLIFHFGWAKPVPIDARYFKKPKRDFAIVALAGPLSNLLIAFVSALICLFLNTLFREISYTDTLLRAFVQNTGSFFNLFHIINLGIAIFNLIPIPPLDGSRILNVILPERTYFKIMRHERKIYYGMLAWLLLGDYVYSFLVSTPIVAASPVLSAIAKIFSLSKILSIAIDGLSSLMFDFWQLIPFLAL